MTPRISTVAVEGRFQAAKWLKVQALLDAPELADLFALAPSAQLYRLSGMFTAHETVLAPQDFCAVYGRWIERLKRGEPLDEVAMRPFAALGWSTSENEVWLQEVPKASSSSLYLVKPSAPFIQIQIHWMHHSSVDGEFRPMVMSSDSIFWGLQFSFPQVYQDPKTLELLEVGGGTHSALFTELRRWMREHTVATPMWAHGAKTNLPIRIGKTCFAWIDSHPQLKSKGLAVAR
jgi:hypothetical protein